MIALYINGCNHARKKHDMDIGGNNVFLGFYYGVEHLWHKSNCAELNDNVRVAIYLLMTDTENIDPSDRLKFNQAKKEFKAIIENCDKSEVEHIKIGAQTYLDYKNRLETELSNGLLNYIETQKFAWSQSDSSKLLLKKLSSYGLENEMKEVTDSISAKITYMQNELSQNNEYYEQIRQQQQYIPVKLKKGIEARQRIFDDLFN